MKLTLEQLEAISRGEEVPVEVEVVPNVAPSGD